MIVDYTLLFTVPRFFFCEKLFFDKILTLCIAVSGGGKSVVTLFAVNVVSFQSFR